MIDKPLPQIGPADIRNLVDLAIAEGTTLDYKETYSLNSDKERGELLADLSSFANTSGGDLVFGIRETNGCAHEIVPFSIADQDAAKQQLENITREGISPRISITPHFVEVDPNRFVLVVRVPRSWTSPNRVIFTGYSKTKDQFYARNSAGKYPMDVVELRNSFTLADTLGDRIRNFRARRVADIVAGTTPVPMAATGKFILHILPFSAFAPPAKADISTVINNQSRLRPIYSTGYSHRINLEGFLAYAGGREEGGCHSYVQLYRSGTVEAVEGLMLSPWRGGDKKRIPSLSYEKELAASLQEYLTLLKVIEVDAPFLIFLTVVGAKGYEMALDTSRVWRDNCYTIDRDILNLPEYLLQGFAETAEDILRPSFDLIWNACGLPRSYNFDENGKWIGDRR